MSGTTAGLNTGKDYQIVITTATGQQVDLGRITGFDHKPRSKTLNHMALNDAPEEFFAPNGHDFTITIDRDGPANDILFSAAETAWWAGGTIVFGSMLVQITEPDGTQSRWAPSGISMFLDNRGDAKADNLVKQNIKGYAKIWPPA
jgi:hypothetical protein